MLTILIVDDNKAIRKMLVELLNPLKVNVLEAANGIEAQKKIQEKIPDLIITDVVMPQMNGYQLCRWIKNNPSTKHIPVVVSSTKGEGFDIKWAEKQGADAYLVKPFQGIELLNTIKRLL